MRTLLTQPADVVRTELVVMGGGLKEGRRLGALRTLARIQRTRGAGALFVGATARLTRRMMQQAFTWAVYEAVVLRGGV